MHGKSIFLSASGSSVKRNLEKKGLRVFIGSVVCIKFVNTTQNADGADTTRTLTLMNAINSGRRGGILLRDDGNATLLATGSRVGIGTTIPMKRSKVERHYCNNMKYQIDQRIY